MPKEILGVEVYSLQETAEILGVTIQTMRNYVRKGLITPVLICGKKYISTDALREYISKGKKIEKQ